MSDNKDDIPNFKFYNSDLSNLSFPTKDYSSIVRNIEPPLIEIDEENTFAYQMQKQTDQILEKSNEQIQLLSKHNQQLAANYKRLEDLYKLKEKELLDSKQEAKKAKRYNIIMLVITVISMLVAVAAWLLPNIFNNKVI